jgi:4'-phosphopantetheinyl transferase
MNNRSSILNECRDLNPNTVSLYVLTGAERQPVPEDAGQLLSEEEHVRASRFVSETARREFLLSRTHVRKILSRYTGIRASELCFECGPQGKLYLSKEQNSLGACFNISHSRGTILLAFCRDREIGVDVEVVRPVTDIEGLINRFYTEEEQASFAGLNTDAFLSHFFRIWVRKEALLKAVGVGIGKYLSRITVPTADPPIVEDFRLPEEIAENREWTIQDITTTAPVNAALCAGGGPFSVEVHAL